MATSIADSFDDEYRKQRILGHVTDMAGTSKSFLFHLSLTLAALQTDLAKATEDSLTNVPKARAYLDEVIADLRRHNNDLLVATALSTQEELLEIGAVIDRALRDMKDLTDNGLHNQSEDAALKAALLRMAQNVT